jgi:signal transduction histidine kinase
MSLRPPAGLFAATNPLRAGEDYALAKSYVDDGSLALDQLRVVAQNFRPNHIVIPVAAAVLCLMFANWVAWPRLVAWFAAAMIGLVPLTLVVRRFLREEQPKGAARAWVERFAAAVFFFTITWGSMAVLLWVPDSDLDHALIILIIGSTLAGNSVLCGASRPVANIAFVAYGAALVLTPLRTGGLVYHGLAALGLAYAGYLFFTAQVYHAVARDMLLLREERRALVERLSKEVADLRAAELRQKETERQLLHSQKLEAIGTLAGGIAHELNNALVPVLALTKFTANRLPPASRERENMLLVHRGAERARDLVRQILAFGRKQQSQQVLFDLGAVLRETTGLMRSTIPSTIAIVEDLAPVPPLYGDPGQLHQAIVNLVNNAAQAIGTAPGSITLRLDEAMDAPLGDGVAAVRLAVEDTGCGMDAATAARIFEPFFTTKGVGDGTGLGLSVVHGIIMGHGGSIEVESAPGKGTRFQICLPVAAEAVAAAAQ